MVSIRRIDQGQAGQSKNQCVLLCYDSRMRQTWMAVLSCLILRIILLGHSSSFLTTHVAYAQVTFELERKHLDIKDLNINIYVVNLECWKRANR